jgi:cell filamentation protein
MGRYDTSTGIEGQMQPGSRGRVLRNLLGFTRKTELDELEFRSLLAAQDAWLNRVSSETRFTTQTLCAMHRDWLGSIYEWAGRYRNVELSKGTFIWPPARLIAQNMEQFDRQFLSRYTPCRPATVDSVARHVAIVHAEFLLVHPFRDGNGRLARWLADLMFLQAGLPLPDYLFTGRGFRESRKQYLQGVKRGYGQDYDLLAAFFADAVARRL